MKYLPMTLVLLHQPQIIHIASASDFFCLNPTGNPFNRFARSSTYGPFTAPSPFHQTLHEIKISLKTKRSLYGGVHSVMIDDDMPRIDGWRNPKRVVLLALNS
jgi:hypothetical protein